MKVAVAGRSLPLSLPVDPFKMPDPSLFFTGNEPPAGGAVPSESADREGGGCAVKLCSRKGDPSESLRRRSLGEPPSGACNKRVPFRSGWLTNQIRTVAKR
jgi:hypothetical protein